jgi:hypothetical protein
MGYGATKTASATCSGAGRPARVRRGALIAMTGACLGLALAGCGGGAARAEVRSVTERFFSALARHDGRAACLHLSRATRRELESEEQKPCARAIEALDVDGAPVTRVQVFITNAKADLANGDSVFLGQGPDGWQLSAIGCQVQGGKPADRPYDCELEA